jgi:hypothetical protein
MRQMRPLYYPPRARWYSCFYPWWFAVRRQLHLDALQPPGGLTLGQCLWGALVPGHIYLVARPRLLGRGIQGLYLLGLGVLVVGLGYPVATFALGLMMALHGASLWRLMRFWPVSEDRRTRTVMLLAAVALLCLGIYWPAQGLVTRYVVLPLRIGDRVVVVAARPRPADLKRGEAVAYRIDPWGRPGVRLAGGYGLGPVEAVGGDRIVFHPDRILINGSEAPRQPFMPRTGEWYVPEKYWFIWPVSAISYGGNWDSLAANVREEVLLSIAMVPESNLVGRPFKRWFGRSQMSP